MKRFIQIILIILVGPVLASCQKEPFLFLSGQNNLVFSENGGSETITFSCNRDWTVSSSANWVKVSPSQGAANEDGVRVSVSCDANNSYDSRTATLTIMSEGLSEVISVSQDTNYGLFSDPNTFNLTNEAQNIEVDVQANVEYSITIDDVCKDWISQIETKALSSAKLTFSISANESYEDREGRITISQKGPASSVQPQIVIVKQSQSNGLFITTPEYELSNDSHNLTIEVKANVEYEVTSEADWIKYEASTTKALSTSSFFLKVEKNESYDPRTGTVKVKGGGLEGVVTISQAENLGLFVSPIETSISKDAQEVEVEVNANIEYDIIVPEEVKGMITTIKKLGGETKALSTTRYLIGVSENTEYIAREASITFKQKDGPLCATLHVMQDQTDFIETEKSSYQIGVQGGTVDIHFSSNVDISLEVSCDWIYLSEKVDGHIILKILDNYSGNESRKEIISIKGGDAVCTVSIDQDCLSAGCYYSQYGTLSRSFENVAIDTVTTATILGYLNDDDFAFLNSIPNIKKIDLSEALCYDNIIPDKAFEENATIEEVVLPNSIYYIGLSAFSNCYKLKKVQFNEGLMYISDNAFYGCENLQGELSIPSTLQYIGSYAFSGCKSITGSLDFSKRYVSIYGYAFSNCVGIKKIEFNKDIGGYIGQYAFNNCTGFKGDFIVPETVSLGSYAFHCAEFDGDVYLNNCGFYSFHSSTISGNLIIGDNLNYVDHTFRSVSVGGYIYLGKGIKTLSSQAFYLTHFETIYVAATTPPNCEDDDTISLGGRTLYVPIGRKNAYSNAEYWKRAEKIEEFDFSKLKILP